MADPKTINFAKTDQEFFTVLNKRVNNYFKENNLSRHANGEMVFKTIFMFSLYFTPIALLFSGFATNTWLVYGLYILAGFGMAGIGLSIMHDANHGSYSDKKWVNNLLGFSLNLVGGHSFNWKMQHNVLHHNYTNIYETDEDISPRGLMRMSPDSPWKSMHKFQHLYAWFFYGFLTFVWVFSKDINRIFKYEKLGMVKSNNSTLTRELVLIAITKIVYLSYTIALPLIVTDLGVLKVLTGFLLMHYVAGFILAIIFQPAHVVDGSHFELPDANGNMMNSWAIHQMKTTTNFAQEAKLFSWYVGGLNYQVEHHLFPNVCHVHYKNLAPILKATAAEYNVPYLSKPTFRKALKSHFNLLKELGQKPHGNVAFA